MTTQAVTTTWKIDPAHSVAEFAVKHLMVSTVKGRFHDLEGRLLIDEDHPDRSWVEARIATASIDTGVEQRDQHLRSDDFFNADLYPYLTFRSTRVERARDNRWNVIGDLTIRDVTREVVLETEFEGQLAGPDGRQVAAFTAETSISRRQFGLKWNAVLDSGAIVVADRVKIILNIEAQRQE